MNIKIIIEGVDDIEDLPMDVLKYGKDALRTLGDFGNYLRTQNKYTLKKKQDNIEEIYDMFFHFLHENNLNRDIVGF